MTLSEAEREVLIALQGYVDDCISTDKVSIKRLDKAWRIILAELGRKNEDTK